MGISQQHRTHRQGPECFYTFVQKAVNLIGQLHHMMGHLQYFMQNVVDLDHIYKQIHLDMLHISVQNKTVYKFGIYRLFVHMNTTEDPERSETSSLLGKLLLT